MSMSIYPVFKYTFHINMFFVCIESISPVFNNYLFGKDSYYLIGLTSLMVAFPWSMAPVIILGLGWWPLFDSLCDTATPHLHTYFKKS